MTHMTPDQARKYLKRYADEEIPDRIAHRALETIAAVTYAKKEADHDQDD